MVKFRTKITENMSCCPKAGQAVTRQRMSSCLLLGRLSCESGEAKWVQRLGRRSEMMMLRWDAAAKMDWPRLGLIKSQGWGWRSADTVNWLWQNSFPHMNLTNSGKRLSEFQKHCWRVSAWPWFNFFLCWQKFCWHKETFSWNYFTQSNSRETF